MSRPVSSLQVVVGKVVAVAVLSAAMQVVLLVSAIVLGKLVGALCDRPVPTADSGRCPQSSTAHFGPPDPERGKDG